MGEHTAISWTHHTFNPWWGCTKVSDGCAHCYAEGFAHRYGHALWGKGAPRRFFGDKHWNEPLKWDRSAAEAWERRRVFCASMADVFDPEVDESHRMRLWGLIERTPNLDWLLLTKRPVEALRMVPADSKRIAHRVWLGTTVEHQRAAEERIPALVDLAAAWGSPIPFLSCEPLLDRVTLRAVAVNRIRWVIVGGESGPKARPMDESWARDLAWQCRDEGIAFWMKQMGGHPNKRHELTDLPEALRVREVPARPVPGETDGGGA